MHNAQSVHILQTEQQLPGVCLDGGPTQGRRIVLHFRVQSMWYIFQYQCDAG